MNNLVRFGVSIDGKLLENFDALIHKKGYVNRSEAIRDLIRDLLTDEKLADPKTEAYGTLTIIYNHDTKEISERLNEIQHNYHGNIISTTHIHIDHHNCLEVLILKGEAHIIYTIADKLQSLRDIKNGKLTITTIQD